MTFEDTGRSKYSAPQALEGYIYQCRLALLETLIKQENSPGLTVSIETLDDIVFKQDKTLEIVQVKQRSKSGNLTDASPNLWKSIRIWMGLQKQEPGKNIAFWLMTTEKTVEGSAAYYLRQENRDVATAEKLLLKTASASNNAELQDIYAHFKSITPEARKSLLESAFILDSRPQSIDIEKNLIRVLGRVCTREKVKIFLAYLEGRWQYRVLKSLQNKDLREISAKELDSMVDDIREGFKEESLPVYKDITIAQVDHTPYMKYPFVEQLKIIEVGPSRIVSAVNSYYRAFKQRSCWVREELLFISEVASYEQQLIEAWETRFHANLEDIHPATSDQEKVQVARTIYAWVENDANIPIRSKCTAKFITTGSYHMLSNKLRVGWHPDYNLKLFHLLKEDNEVTE